MFINCKALYLQNINKFNINSANKISYFNFNYPQCSPTLGVSYLIREEKLVKFQAVLGVDNHFTR